MFDFLKEYKKLAIESWSINAINTMTKQKGDMKMNGKAGTITPDEFELLSAMVETFGPVLVVQKIAKICGKNADLLAHEYPSSSLASAWRGIASKISGAFTSSTRAVSKTDYSNLSEMVMSYGPEIIVAKVAKIAVKSGHGDATRLKGLFPVSSNVRRAA